MAQYTLDEDAGDSTFNQNLRQLTVFLFIAMKLSVNIQNWYLLLT
jgi:hypothetical protein